MIGLILWLIVITIITFNAPAFFLFTFVILPALMLAIYGIFETLDRLTNKRK